MYTVLDYRHDFHAVLEQTMCVVQWFTLGSLLKVEPHVLEGIDKDYRGDHRECRERMLLAWLKTAEATWQSLVYALRAMGHTDVAKKIAWKEGVCVLLCYN